MSQTPNAYAMPAERFKSDGSERRVGFEIEFSGLGLLRASEVLEKTLDGQRLSSTAAEHRVHVAHLGEFGIEIDWSLLKSLAGDEQLSEQRGDWLEYLGTLATTLVPIEIVCPPIAISELGVLDALIDSLRGAGATGTSESLAAAYGVHINPELPSLDIATIDRYLRAFCLLQWWLFDAHAVDLMRKITPYINPYPAEYLHQVLAREETTEDTLFDDYLAYNATRNRGLDLLPLLSEIDAKRVLGKVQDERIGARPTFHYRLPNCLIGDPEWSLHRPWQLWCVVERLADDSRALEDLRQRFLSRKRGLLDAEQKQWKEEIDTWLREYEWV